MFQVANCIGDEAREQKTLLQQLVSRSGQEANLDFIFSMLLVRLLILLRNADLLKKCFSYGMREAFLSMSLGALHTCRMCVPQAAFAEQTQLRELCAVLLPRAAAVLVQEDTMTDARSAVRTTLKKIDISLSRGGSNKYLFQVILFALAFFLLLYLWKRFG